MITFSQVSVEKNGVRILDCIDLRLTERRIGVIGRNGSGKSTFARLFNGIETPTAGTVTLDGLSGSRDMRRHVGFVFQIPTTRSSIRSSAKTWNSASGTSSCRAMKSGGASTRCLTGSISDICATG